MIENKNRKNRPLFVVSFFVCARVFELIFSSSLLSLLWYRVKIAVDVGQIEVVFDCADNSH